MHQALEAEIGIERIVVRTGDHDILVAHAATKPFDAIIRAVVDLDEIGGGAVADAAERDAVQLVAGADFKAREAHLNIGQAARVVSRAAAAVERAGEAFDGRLARNRAGRCAGANAGVDRRAAEHDDAAPLADRAVVHGAFHVGTAGEDDRAGGAAFGKDLRTTVDHQRIGTRRAEHDHARFDGENALNCASSRRAGISAQIGADVDAARQRINGAADVAQREPAGDGSGNLAIAQIIDDANIGGAGGAIGSRASRGGCGCRGRGGGRGRRRHHDGAFTGRRDVLGTIAGDQHQRRTDHEQVAKADIL